MGPADLSEILGAVVARSAPDDRVLVGPATSDDAGVYRLGATALVATADFITPACDDPRRFGRVAAANAVSDVFAMGGSVLFALNLCCFPEGKVPAAIFTEILEGGLEKLAEAGGVLLGGHSVHDAELKYGLAVVGTVDPARILTNAGARAGDQLVLSKPLGTGAIINAFRKDEIGPAELEPALAGMERLNDAAARLALQHGATACTDITGYGLAGHALEIARASGVGLRVAVGELPVYEGFAHAVELGVSTRGTRANEAAATPSLQAPASLSLLERQLLFDPQTSGGLLMSVPEAGAAGLLEDLARTGHRAARIGEVLDGPRRLEIV